MMWKNRLLISFLCLAGFADQTLAHHSITPHFDPSQPVTISGVVTEFKFVNPHSFVYLDVVQPDGSIANWNCELQAAVILRHSGWTKDLLAPGTKVTINGSAARRDLHGCAVGSILLDDGTQLSRGGVIRSSTGEQLSNSTSSNNTGYAPDDGASIFDTWRTGNHFRPAGDLTGDLISWPLEDRELSQEEIGTAENPLGIYMPSISQSKVKPLLPITICSMTILLWNAAAQVLCGPGLNPTGSLRFLSKEI